MINHMYGNITKDMLTSDAISIIGFTRGELTSPDAGKERADALISTCTSVGKRAHGIVIITYAYDDDPREIYEIPEIVAHIKYMLAKCPYLLYFLPSDLAITRPLLLALYDAIVLSAKGGVAQIGIKDIDAARAASKKMQDDVMAYAVSIGDRLGGLDTVSGIKQLGV